MGKYQVVLVLERIGSAYRQEKQRMELDQGDD